MKKLVSILLYIIHLLFQDLRFVDGICGGYAELNGRIKSCYLLTPFVLLKFFLLQQERRFKVLFWV